MKKQHKITWEEMTPIEYKNGGENLTIHYSYASSPFGEILVASTEKGLCYMAFFEEKENAFKELHNNFPKAKFIEHQAWHQNEALKIFGAKKTEIKLHLKGTPFQLKVWNILLKIPSGTLSTYGKIAEEISNIKASRAVGTAVGSNNIAYIIPCHRVVREDGSYGEYRWGRKIKTALLNYEEAFINRQITLF